MTTTTKIPAIKRAVLRFLNPKRAEKALAAEAAAIREADALGLAAFAKPEDDEILAGLLELHRENRRMFYLSYLIFAAISALFGLLMYSMRYSSTEIAVAVILSITVGPLIVGRVSGLLAKPPTIEDLWRQRQQARTEAAFYHGVLGKD